MLTYLAKSHPGQGPRLSLFCWAFALWRERLKWVGKLLAILPLSPEKHWARFNRAQKLHDTSKNGFELQKKKTLAGLLLCQWKVLHLTNSILRNAKCKLKWSLLNKRHNWWSSASLHERWHFAEKRFLENERFLVIIFSQITRGISALVKGAKSSCRYSNAIYCSAWTASSNASLLEMSLERPFPEASRSCSSQLHQHPSLGGVCKHRCQKQPLQDMDIVTQEQGQYNKFHLRENKGKVFAHALSNPAWGGLTRQGQWQAQGPKLPPFAEQRVEKLLNVCSLLPLTLPHLRRGK